jgi:hypothetical protein
MPRLAESNATAGTNEWNRSRLWHEVIEKEGLGLRISTIFVVAAMLLLLVGGFMTAGCVKVQDLSSPEKTAREWYAAQEAKDVGRMESCLSLTSRQELNVDFQGIESIQVTSIDVEVLSQTDTEALIHVVADIETTKSSGEVTTDNDDLRWSLTKRSSKWLVTSFAAE